MKETEKKVNTVIEEEVESNKEYVDTYKQKIRAIMDNVYDIQKLRIATGNRIVASFKDLATISHEREARDKKIIDKVDMSNEYMGEKEDDIKEQRIIQNILSDYNIITNYFADRARQNKPKDSTIESAIKSMDSENSLKIIHTVFEYQMASTYMDLINTEKNAVAVLTKQIKMHPMWEAFFKDVKGCGPVMAAICIGYLDVKKARHISSFWRYAGLDVVNGEGRGRKHSEMREYVNKKGEVSEKKSLTFNPILKSKLLGVLGSSFIKCGKDGKYNEIYYNYKNRIINREANSEKEPLTSGHIHNMAVRYTVKIFLMDMWLAWRKLEGLPVEEPYSVAYLGRNPHGYNAATDMD